MGTWWIFVLMTGTWCTRSSDHARPRAPVCSASRGVLMPPTCVTSVTSRPHLPTRFYRAGGITRGVDMRYLALISLVLALAACGSSNPAPEATHKLATTTAPSSAAAPSPTPTTTAPSTTAPSTTAPAAPAGPTCGSQVTSWLAEPDGSGITGNTVQHDISAIIFDVKAYQEYDPGNTGAGQNFLNFLNTEVTNLTYTSTPNAPPTCADPDGIWGADLTSGTFLGDASDASDDTAGTSQAASDVHAVLNDFATLNAELLTTSGVQAKGYAGTP
jgi:hypothetical protein